MRKKAVALIDCNSFYVSCERVFNASIAKQAVIVLSNNDGCIVSLSAEAKRLGLKRGQPIFQHKDIIAKHHVHIFSSNYSLYADEKWIRRHLTVTGERIVLELRGISCIPIETEQPPKQGIMCAKTFGREVTSREELEEAVATYTARVAEKLRQQDSLAGALTVFIRTNTFNTNIPQYSNSFTIQLPYPTAFTPDLIAHALKG